MIYPPAPDDGYSAHRAIANHLGCDPSIAERAFDGLDVIEWITPPHLDEVRRTSHANNEAARHATNLYNALRKLDPDDREGLILRGAPTMQQVEFLADILSDDSLTLKTWAQRPNRTGGRNPAAYAVAEGVRRLFRRLRKPITYGLRPEGGPSTDFGRAVEFAIGAFGVRADWRGPARAAIDKQLRHENRLTRCADFGFSTKFPDSPIAQAQKRRKDEMWLLKCSELSG